MVKINILFCLFFGIILKFCFGTPLLTKKIFFNFFNKENDQTKREKNNEWKNSLVLIKSKVGQQHSHWPIPEAFWPDSVKYLLIKLFKNIIYFLEILCHLEMLIL